MVLNYRKHQPNITKDILKDARGDFPQIRDKLRKKELSSLVFFVSGFGILFHPWFLQITEVLLMFCLTYFWWLHKKPETLPFKMPKSANKPDPNSKAPGSGKTQQAGGILFLGNDDASGEEIWFDNSDARTHILYLGTTGSGKTEGLKGLVTNALGWGSGCIYIDGKADTDLWGSLSALTRRYGRDDDLLVLNYMTGNSDKGAVSNSVNPFALGSASYLTNLLVSLMPDSGGDNAMWKDRAVALMAALMPVLTWMRDELEIPLSINVIRDQLVLSNVIRLSRDSKVPQKIRKEILGYLNALPGFQESFYNDDGSPRSGANGQPNDTSVIDQQHGYLTMQFTRQLQSLAGDYGYIFLNEYADIDIMDVVLNRRLLIVLIPALEKSADETANLGKIIGSLLKGMMGSTLGASVEGDTDSALENKPTRAPTPFMAIFDEVGYYTTQGMAVMAAQARSLGFSLVFAGQDLPALEKRIKEEARSITANCNIKIFGKLEDPTQTKEFFEKTVGKALVLESGGRKQTKTMFGSKVYEDSDQYSLQAREKADYDDLKGYLAGQAVVCFGDHLVKGRMFFSNPGKIKSLRVNRFVPMAHPDPTGKRGSRDVEAVLERFRDKNWTAENAVDTQSTPQVIASLAEGFAHAREQHRGLIESGAYALCWTAYREGNLKKEDIPDPALAKTEIQSDTPKAAETSVLTAPDQNAEPLNAMPDLTARKQDDEPAAAKPAPRPTVAATPMRIEPTLDAPPDADTTDTAPSEPPPLRADKADSQAERATAESVSWSDFLNGETAETIAAKKNQAAPAKTEDDPATPEAQEAIRKGTQETVSWAALMGESQPATKPPAAPAPATIPQSSFGYGGFGAGISYASSNTLKPPVPTPAPAETGAPRDQLKDNAPAATADKTDDADAGTSETINWKDLL